MTPKHPKSQVSNVELSVLKVLKERLSVGVESLEQTSEVAELASLTGVRDSDEILRALYTLEGKSLVQPQPPGDLTSSLWKITDGGVKALSILSA